MTARTRVALGVQPSLPAFIAVTWLISTVGGCATSLRVGAAPTLDTTGAWGGVVSVGLAFGETYRAGTAAVLVGADVSGAGDEQRRGHIGLGIGADALGESARFGFRIGLTLTGRANLADGSAGGAVGGRLALLPVVRYVHWRSNGPPGHCGPLESWSFWHVGLEASGQWLWGTDARGLFAVGPVFEIDALQSRLCD
jgi:hypothetical protein